MHTRWNHQTALVRTKPMRPITEAQPSPCRVLRRVATEVNELSVALHRSLDAAMTDQNERQLERAGELLVWLDAIRDEARSIVTTLGESR